LIFFFLGVKFSGTSSMGVGRVWILNGVSQEVVAFRICYAAHGHAVVVHYYD